MNQDDRTQPIEQADTPPVDDASAEQTHSIPTDAEWRDDTGAQGDAPPARKFQPPANPAAPQKLQIAERRLMALALRKQGGSYRKIADQLRQQPGISPKYSEALAHRDVMEELRRLNAQLAEEAAEVKRIELERLDELFVSFWAMAKKGDIPSTNMIFGIMDRRARYQGLYEATKIDFSRMTNAELVEFITRLFGENSASPGGSGSAQTQDSAPSPNTTATTPSAPNVS